MKNRSYLSFVGAVLLLSAALLAYGAGRPASAQTSAKTSAKKKKGKSTKSRKSSKPVGQKAPTPDRIKDIQSALQREGAYDGEPTGKWDDSTVEAMKKYQDKNGITPTGKIDAQTLNKLGLGSETAGKGAPVPTASSTTPSNPSGK
jgi:peptidoglycan hydrolase-like protein with peptidoglycan-binding domain